MVGHDAADTLTISVGGALDLQTATLGVDGGSAAINTQGNAGTAITAIDAAIDTVTGLQGGLGGAVNTLNRFTALHQSARSNTEAALSVIEGVDVAYEMVNYTKASVIQQASISMLAQGNMASQNMLALFA